MTDANVNGAVPPPDEALQRLHAELQCAIDAYGRSLAESKRVGPQQINVNPLEVMVQGKLTEVQFGLLLEILAQLGAVSPIAWKQLVTQRLQQLTVQLTQTQPTILIAPAGTIGRKQ